jgi:hypothetical protein
MLIICCNKVLAAFASFFNDLSITENYACKFIITKNRSFINRLHISHTSSLMIPQAFNWPGIQLQCVDLMAIKHS